MIREDYRGVQFCRISDLEVTDRFMINGIWRYVFEIKAKSVKYYNLLDKKNVSKVSHNSKQFVEVIKEVNNPFIVL
jgi:hypothetical protein